MWSLSSQFGGGYGLINILASSTPFDFRFSANPTIYSSKECYYFPPLVFLACRVSKAGLSSLGNGSNSLPTANFESEG